METNTNQREHAAKTRRQMNTIQETTSQTESTKTQTGNI